MLIIFFTYWTDNFVDELIYIILDFVLKWKNHSALMVLTFKCIFTKTNITSNNIIYIIQYLLKHVHNATTVNKTQKYL